MADCVSEPTILWVLDTTMSAPQRERVGRQLLVKGQMRTPGLVHHQRHPVRVRDVHEGCHIGHGAEVGRRDRGSTDGLRGRRQRHIERLGRQAMRDAQLGVDLGGHERGRQAGEDAAVDGARVRVALNHDPVARVGEREQGHVVALRGAVDQEPASRRPPCLRRQGLRLLEGRGRRAGVDAPGERRYVHGQRALANRLTQLRIGRRAALVAGHVDSPGVARDVGAQGLQVRHFGLVGHRWRVYGRRWRVLARATPRADGPTRPSARRGR